MSHSTRSAPPFAAPPGLLHGPRYRRALCCTNRVQDHHRDQVPGRRCGYRRSLALARLVVFLNAHRGTAARPWGWRGRGPRSRRVVRHPRLCALAHADHLARARSAHEPPVPRRDLGARRPRGRGMEDQAARTWPIFWRARRTPHTPSRAPGASPDPDGGWPCSEPVAPFARHGQGSPGNLQDFEEMLFASSVIAVAPVVLALRIANNTAGDKVRRWGHPRSPRPSLVSPAVCSPQRSAGATRVAAGAPPADAGGGVCGCHQPSLWRLRAAHHRLYGQRRGGQRGPLPRGDDAVD